MSTSLFWWNQLSIADGNNSSNPCTLPSTFTNAINSWRSSLSSVDANWNFFKGQSKVSSVESIGLGVKGVKDSVNELKMVLKSIYRKNVRYVINIRMLYYEDARYY